MVVKQQHTHQLVSVVIGIAETHMLRCVVAVLAVHQLAVTLITRVYQNCVTPTNITNKHSVLGDT